VPSSPGVPASLAKDTYNAVYNDLGSVEKIFKKDPGNVACVIVEGVPGNMGVVCPDDGFLKGLKRLARRYGALFIMDEVMSGFRLCYGGAQKAYDIDPDITCLGKVIGGGLPVGAFGGKRRYMERLAPTGPVYQAGTLSGNPIAMTAGIETLKILRQKSAYDRLFRTTDRLAAGIADIAARKGVPVYIAVAGSMFTVFFTDKPVRNYNDVCETNIPRFAKYFRRMLANGVYVAPSAFEASFVSLAHTKEDVDKTLIAVEKSFTRF
jgi:glutamate-1-semialdehyde 2,1-aminomutase